MGTSTKTDFAPIIRAILSKKREKPYYNEQGFKNYPTPLAPAAEWPSPHVHDVVEDNYQDPQHYE